MNKVELIKGLIKTSIGIDSESYHYQSTTS